MGTFGSPYPGKAQHPQEQRYPFLSVCAVFPNVQAMVRLPVLGIFNMRCLLTEPKDGKSAVSSKQGHNKCGTFLKNSKKKQKLGNYSNARIAKDKVYIATRSLVTMTMQAVTNR